MALFKACSDVYLTIDLDLQKTAEQALKRAIASAANSSSGAVVASDIAVSYTHLYVTPSSNYKLYARRRGKVHGYLKNGMDLFQFK